MNETSTNGRSNMVTCADMNELMSGFVDGELMQQQEQRVRVHIETCASCKRKLEELGNLKAQIRELSYPKSDEQVLDALEQDLLARSSAHLGWIMLVTGFVLLVGAGMYRFFSSPDLPALVRITYGLFMLGGISLFVAVLRQRLMTWKNDRYRKVKL